MAKRLVFYLDASNGVAQKEYKFKWYPGFAKTQLQKSVRALHNCFLHDFPNKNILEVSSASWDEVAQSMSAMNLSVITSHGQYTVEQLFQAGKVFAKAGEQKRLLNLSSKEAKKSNKETSKDDQLVGFKIFDTSFPLEPKTYFYNWIYMKALHQHPEIVDKIVQYDAFTDIFFNSEKAINCQAQACCIYVSLLKRGLLEETLKNRENFLRGVYV